MIDFGLDPGTERSALVAFNGERVLFHVVAENAELLEKLSEPVWANLGRPILIIEKIESYGMAVGESTFTTVFWSGRFAQAWFPRRFEQMGRRIVKQHLCHTARATDSNIRQAILDRFGGEKAIGRKASQGPLYGLKGHEFAALAVALTFYDQHAHQPETIRPGVTPEF